MSTFRFPVSYRSTILCQNKNIRSQKPFRLITKHRMCSRTTFPPLFYPFVYKINWKSIKPTTINKLKNCNCYGMVLLLWHTQLTSKASLERLRIPRQGHINVKPSSSTSCQSHCWHNAEPKTRRTRNGDWKRVKMARSIFEISHPPDPIMTRNGYEPDIRSDTNKELSNLNSWMGKLIVLYGCGFP